MPILEVETDKIANAVEAPDPGLLRRRLATAGEVLPVKALLGVMAPAEVSDAEIDAFVATYVVPAAGEGDEAEAGPAYLFTEVDGIRVRYARRGEEGRPECRCCSCTASAATSTTGCSTSTRWPPWPR